MDKKAILELVENMKPRDHSIFLYSDIKTKHEVLFTFIKAGLDKGEAAAYIATEESPDQIRQGMLKFGIDVERYESQSALRIMGYRGWYITEGRFDAKRIMGLWESLLAESRAKGLKGLRVTGEMICFVKEKLVKELLEYEKSLHTKLSLPMIAICAYNEPEIVKEMKGKAVGLVYDVLKAHGSHLVLDKG